ncbi:Cdc6/Cdc18 family protein [Natronobacterium texcoconense]|uniref:AAA domain-containing protein n=1 Tax=Natronobacterium texcoconense TaxID=1095778 RepID=A0A1H1AL87_NATTX|nr:AAA family ATPase [Natronobacterium texcoconense]SDQ39976.1 AAA domain-containing protein [Natronobacterium texcoconense]
MFDDSYGSEIIRAEEYLTADHPHHPPVERDAELHTIRDALRPLTKRKTPENLLVYGPPGSGKTTCVNHVFEALETEAGVKTVQINCWQYSTRPALLTEILIQLGYPAPRKGKPVDERLGKLREWLDRNRSVAIALDEFDQLEDKAAIVYDLHMLSQQTENKLGLVLISNIPPDGFVLDERSWSRLNCRAVEFKPYTAEELLAILKDRVEQAFRPGAVQPEVLELVADSVADNGGDCRDAFERLLQAGRRATREGAREVTPQFLEEIDG